MPYQLAPGAFLCRSGPHAVFLDLVTDRYLSVPWARVATLGTEARTGVADALLRRGLILDAPKGGRPLEPIAYPTADRLLRSDGEVAAASSLYVLPFCVACVRALFRRRYSSISRTVRRIRLRKIRRARTADLAKCRRLVGIFQALRPWVPVRRSCLVDCLLLIEFLALFDVFPDWVFGVRTNPFSAHCWLQRDSVLLADALERVGGYVPIMVV